MPKISTGARRDAVVGTIRYIKDSVQDNEHGTHNLIGEAGDLGALHKEFKNNESGRGVRTYYHEWVSFHPKDKSKCDKDFMRDFSEDYINKVYDDHRVYWGVHREKEHIHVHLCISATNIYGKKLHLSGPKVGEKDRFVQEYAKNNGMDFLESLQIGKSRNQSHEERQMGKKGVKTEKEQCQLILQRIIDNPAILTHEKFLEQLQKSGLRLTERETGIKYRGRKYRFKTLGYDKGLVKERKFEKYRSQKTMKKIKDGEKELRVSEALKKISKKKPEQEKERELDK
jgi:hypothetical protein